MRQDPPSAAVQVPGLSLRAVDLCVFLKTSTVKFGIVKFKTVKFNSGGGLCLCAGYP
jgi:hypothetical protein